MEMPDPVIPKDAISTSSTRSNAECNIRKTVFSWWPSALPVVVFILLVLI